MRVFIVVFTFFVASFIVSCGEETVSGKSGTNSLLNIIDEPTGEKCAYGGKKVQGGVDKNSNGTLDADEITTDHYICNGADGAPGSAGSNGANGVNCWDLNNNGVCDKATEDINKNGNCTPADCHGDKGDAGENGEDGAAGSNGLACWDYNGNHGCDESEDINVDGDCTVLDCKGEDGKDGISCWDTNGNGICDVDTEDTNKDGVCGALDCIGAPGTAGQNGAPGLDGLDGLACWDADGDRECDETEDMNGDGNCDVLDCKGEDGEDGLKSLIRTEDEPPSPEHCKYGGIKVLSGIDDNNDGYLDDDEVDDTAYVCHGVPQDTTTQCYTEHEIRYMACGYNYNGIMRQICDGTNWQDMELCDDPDECKNDTTQTLTDVCGLNTRGEQPQLCSLGQWIDDGDCIDNEECVDNTPDTTSCGFNGNGTQGLLCVMGYWENDGDCDDPDECENTTTRTLTDVCGFNTRGEQPQICEGGFWVNDGDCVDPDECESGTPQTVPCSTGTGLQPQQCIDGQWIDDGNCTVDSWDKYTEPRISECDSTHIKVEWNKISSAVAYKIYYVSGTHYTFSLYKQTTENEENLMDYLNTVFRIDAVSETDSVVDRVYLTGQYCYGMNTQITNWAAGDFFDDFEDSQLKDIYVNLKPHQVVEANGYLQLTQTITDDYSQFYLPYDAQGNRYIRVVAKIFQHRTNDEYTGGLLILDYLNQWKRTAFFNPHEDYRDLHGVNMRWIDYQEDLPVRIDYKDEEHFTVQLNADDHFDQWFDWELLINTETGQATGKINGVTFEAQDVNFKTTGKILLHFSPYGWWTGHYLRVDDLKVESFNLLPGECQTIPLDADHWRYYNDTRATYMDPTEDLYEISGDGILIRSEGYRSGARLHSVANFAVAGNTLYMKWRANSDGGYMHCVPAMFQGEDVYDYEYYSEKMFTYASAGNEWNGSWLVQPDIWYYTRVVFDGANYVGYTASGNYDDAGGTDVHTYSEAFTAGEYKIMLRNGDNQGGALSYIMLGEAKICAPAKTWMKTFGGDTNDDAYGSGILKRSSDGNYLVVGKTHINDAEGDAYLVKFDTNGDQVHAKTYGGDLIDWFSSIIPFGSGYVACGGSQSYGSARGLSYCVMMDEDNVEGNHYTYGGADATNTFDIAPTNDGKFVTAGNTTDTDAWLDFVIRKIDTDGTEIWKKYYGRSQDDTAWNILPISDGGYLVTGFTGGWSSCQQIYIMKLNSSGDKVWEKLYGPCNSTQQWQEARQSIELADGSFIVTGTIYNSGTQDAFIMKLDSVGEQTWIKTYGGTGVDKAMSIVKTTDGGYAITGHTNSMGAGGDDIYLVKTDSSGNEQWHKTFGGASSDQGNSILQTEDGGFMIAGNTQSWGSGGNDIVVIKTDASGNVEE